jgi:hypothetical protein
MFKKCWPRFRVRNSTYILTFVAFFPVHAARVHCERHYKGVFFKFGVEVGVEESIEIAPLV